MFLYSHWLELPLATRASIAEQFHFIKNGPTHVQDNRVISDGYSIKDVESALTLEALQEFTGAPSTHLQTLWDLLVAKIEGKDITGLVSELTTFNGTSIEPGIVPPVVDGETKPIIEAPKKRGRPPGVKSKAK